VTGLFFIFVLMWVALTVLLFVGSMWLQDYMYSQPAERLYWRAPAAATAVTLVIALWCFLDYKSPQNFPALFDFTPQKNLEPAKELWAVHGGKEVHYTQRKTPGGRPEFRDNNNRLLPSRPEAIIILEDGERIRFEPEKDDQGNYKTEKGQTLRYRDSKGRVMLEYEIGQLAESRSGLLLGNLLLSVFHFGVWFAALWLLLRFQWSHALGIAVGFWLIMTLMVVPMLIARVEKAAKNKAKEQTVQAMPIYYSKSLSASRNSLGF
jgi:hypothetical protein